MIFFLFLTISPIPLQAHSVFVQAGESTDAEVLGMLLQVRYLQVSNRLDEAVALVEKAVALDPDHADAAFLQCELLMARLEERRFSPASEQKAFLLKLAAYGERFPDDYRFQKMLGNLTLNGGTSFTWEGLEEPGSYLERAGEILRTDYPKRTVELAETLYQLAKYYAKASRYLDAADTFAEVCGLEPDNYWAFYYAAQSYEAAHMLRTALSYYERYDRVVRNDSWGRRPDAKMRIQILKAKLMPGKRSLAVLLQALAMSDTPWDEMINVARELIQAGRLDAALSLLDSLPEKAKSGNYHHYRLYTLMELGRFSQALKEAQAILPEIQSGAAKELIVDYASEAALLSGNWSEAVFLARDYDDLPGVAFKLRLFSAFATALMLGDESDWWALSKTYPSDPFLRSMNEHAECYGVAFVAKLNILGLHLGRDLPTAMTYVDHQFSFPPPVPAARDVAAVYALNGWSDGAFMIYDYLLTQHPDDISVFNDYGYFLADEGRELERARDMITRALAAEPENSAFLDSMGWVLYQMGDFEAAENYLNQALAVDSDDPEKLEHLGDVLSALGKDREAMRAWSRAMEFTEGRYMQILNKLDP